jgi:hypothetical protein
MSFIETLKLDFDFRPTKRWLRLWIVGKMAMLKALGYTPGELIIKFKGRGFHAWWNITKSTPFTDDEVNMIQWLCCDDVTRVRINRYRTRRGIKKYWNKIFSAVSYRKPLPKNCQNCQLRKVLAECESDLLKPEGEYPESFLFRPGIDDPMKIAMPIPIKVTNQ